MNETSKDLLLRGLYEQETIKAQREHDVKLLEATLALAHELRLGAVEGAQEITRTLLQSGVAPGEVESVRPTRPSYFDPGRTAGLLDQALLRIEHPKVFAAANSTWPSGIPINLDGGAGGGG